MPSHRTGSLLLSLCGTTAHATATASAERAPRRESISAVVVDTVPVPVVVLLWFRGLNDVRLNDVSDWHTEVALQRESSFQCMQTKHECGRLKCMQVQLALCGVAWCDVGAQVAAHDTLRRAQPVPRLDSDLTTCGAGLLTCAPTLRWTFQACLPPSSARWRNGGVGGSLPVGSA